jgi:ribosomal protein S18 acetylase RimI-like enzyme
VSQKKESFDLSSQLTEDWLSKVLFRHVDSKDLYALEWEGEYSQFRRVYADVFRRSQEDKAAMWVAELPKVGIIGQVFVQLTSDYRPELANGKTRAYVHAFRVRPAYRDSGLGTCLMQTVENFLVARDFRNIYLTVAQDNLGARRLYERLGYKVVAVEPGHWSYRDEKGKLCHMVEPSWLMWKSI